MQAKEGKEKKAVDAQKDLENLGGRINDLEQVEMDML